MNQFLQYLVRDLTHCPRENCGPLWCMPGYIAIDYTKVSCSGFTPREIVNVHNQVGCGERLRDAQCLHGNTRRRESDELKVLLTRLAQFKVTSQRNVDEQRTLCFEVTRREASSNCLRKAVVISS